jgi:hypothetical protein
LEAVRSTTELSDSGRDGRAGVAAVVAVFDDGVAAVVDVGMAADGVKADDEAACPLSHGFGGDGVAMFYQR